MRAGLLRHVVRVQNPGTPAADGDGAYTQTWADAEPVAWPVSIEPATAARLERLAAGTVLSTATHIITGRYHAAVTLKTRLLFGVRTFAVTGVQNPDERNISTVALCAEVVTNG